jgi:membrane-associated phospholipid phosphatase
MWLGLFLFYLIPTTPPWLAAQQGSLDGVFRVMDFVGGSVDASTYESFYASLGEPNSVAAMPSIHVGVTFALALWCMRFARLWALPAVIYTVLMGLALVYLAEHYVADLGAGVLVALLALWVASRTSAWPDTGSA